MAFYVDKQNCQSGPVPIAYLRQLLEQHEIQLDTLTWFEGQSDWLPYQESPLYSISTGEIPATDDCKNKSTNDSPQLNDILKQQGWTIVVTKENEKVETKIHLFN